jgi:predicted DNA-binding transcriptional regulator YafY
MPKSPNQKLKLLYLRDMLLQETDDAHGLSMPQIITRLAEKGVAAERKSLYDDLDALRAWGMDIVARRGKATEYAVGRRDFELPELMLLIDAVQNSRFISERKCGALTGKLRRLASKHESRALKKRVYIEGRVQSQNESVYYNVDAIQQALERRRRIAFDYFSYGMDMRRHLKSSKASNVLIPVGLAYVEDKYYLITYDEHHDSYTHYRVDRMASIEVTNLQLPKLPQVSSFDTHAYCQRTFHMHVGEDTGVALCISAGLVNSMIDQYGTGLTIYPIDADSAHIHISVKKSRPFFGWLAQFGTDIQIVSPKALAEEYVRFLEEIAALYS